MRTRIKTELGGGALLIAVAVVLLTSRGIAGECGLELFRASTATVCTGTNLWGGTVMFTTGVLGSISILVATVELMYTDTPSRKKTWYPYTPSDSDREGDESQPQYRNVYTTNPISKHTKSETPSEASDATEEESTAQSSNSRT